MGIQTRLGPFANGLNIALREFCRPMHQKIGSQRHIVTLHFLADCLEALARVFRGIFRVAPHPIGKIRVPATAIDVIDHEPRYRRHITVPRPARQIGVAVVTRALQDAFDLRRHWDDCVQSVRWNNKRIGARGPNQLDADEQTQKSEQCASKECRQLR